MKDHKESERSAEGQFSGARWLDGFIRSSETQPQIYLGVAQSYQPTPDSKDNEYPPLVVPLPEHIGKYIQIIDHGGYGYGTYRVHDAPPNIRAKQTGLFYRLSRRVSIWICNMRVFGGSYHGGASPSNAESSYRSGPVAT